MTGKISAKLVSKKLKLLLSREELIWTCSDAVMQWSKSEILNIFVLSDSLFYLILSEQL